VPNGVYANQACACEILNANLIDVICIWQQSKWGFIQYDTHTTCLVFVFIDSSEARKKHVEYYLSNILTINYALDRTHFQGPGRMVPVDLRE
jgi:hypothetical protein